MEDSIFMTQKGYDEAVAKLKYLQVEKRAEITKKISEARDHGDLSENAEYDAAKQEEASNATEIAELESKIKRAKIIEEDFVGEGVHIGSKVKIYDYDMEEEVVYTISGSMEADPRNNIISNDSPVGKVLMGKKGGDVLSVTSPSGIYKIKILEIL